MDQIHTMSEFKITSPAEIMTPEEWADRGREIEAQEAAAREEAKQTRYEKSGTPRRYWGESLATYKTTTEGQKKAAAAVDDFIKNVQAGRSRILVLLGPVGTGKTHLCGAAIRELGGQYMTAAEMVEEIRHAKAFNAAATEKEIIERYARARVAVMDEIGRGINAADEKYMLYGFINALYNLRGSAIITSNFNKSDFLQYVGAAVADRLVEYGAIVEITGDSYRKELRRQNGRNE